MERWKEPREGSEIESETVSLQAVGARWTIVQVSPRTSCIMSQRVNVAGKVKPLKVEP